MQRIACEELALYRMTNWRFLFSSVLADNELRLCSLQPFTKQLLPRLATVATCHCRDLPLSRLVIAATCHSTAQARAGAGLCLSAGGLSGRFCTAAGGGDAELLQMLLKSRVDLMLADTAGTLYLPQQLAPNARLYVSTTALSKTAVHLTQDPQAASLLAEFGQGLARLKASGEADRLPAPLQY